MIKLEESISVGREGVSCFPSRQCSIRLCSAATTNLSHSSLSRRSTIILSLSPPLSRSTPQAPTYDRATHTTHKHTQQASQLQRIQQRSSTIYKTKIFSIDHRSAPWLVTTPIIDLGLDSLVDISCIGMYVNKHTPADITKHACPRICSSRTNHASPRTYFTRTNRSIACGGEFKVKVGYSTC